MDNGGGGTFTSLENKLETLLTFELPDGTVLQPVVILKPGIVDGTISLELEIELSYGISTTAEVNIDPELVLSENDITTLGPMAKTLSPADDGDSLAASVALGGQLTFRLGVGAKFDSVTNLPIFYVLQDKTNVQIDVYATATLMFTAIAGPVEISVNGAINIGTMLQPISLLVQLDSGTARRLSATDSNKIELQSILDGSTGLSAVFGGVLSATLDLSLLGIPGFNPTAHIDLRCDDLNEALAGNRSAFVSSISVISGIPVIPGPLDLLLESPARLLKSLNKILKGFEDFTLGRRGLITTFPVPLIGKSLGKSLGAGTDDNVLGIMRRSLIGLIEGELGAYAGEEQLTVAEILASAMNGLLGDLGILQNGEVVSAKCFQSTEQIPINTEVLCNATGGNAPTSVEWNVPIGQTYITSQPLNFNTQNDLGVPLEISLEGTPELTVTWGFDLVFGYDATDGMYLGIYENKAELRVAAQVSVVGASLDAKILFLKTELSGLDILIGAGINLNIAKPEAKTGVSPNTGRTKNRILLKDVKAIGPRNLFTIDAIAGATIEFAAKTSIDLPSELDAVENYIPRVDFDFAAQFRYVKQLYGGGSRMRRSLSQDEHHRNLQKFQDRRRLVEVADLNHPAHDILRWLAEDETGITSTNFGSEWSPCPLQSDKRFCAIMYDARMDIKTLYDKFINPILKKFVNGDSGYLDMVARPFLFLEEKLPIIESSILDIAVQSTEPRVKKSAVNLKAFLQLYQSMLRFQAIADSDTILLADRYDIIEGTKCGGVFAICPSQRRLQQLRGRNDTSALFFDNDEFEFGTSRDLTANSDCSNLKKGSQARINCQCQNVKSGPARETCKSTSTQAITFPFLQNPASILNLFTGGDIVSFKSSIVVLPFSLSDLL